jgi:hypothetical protein
MKPLPAAGVDNFSRGLAHDTLSAPNPGVGDGHMKTAAQHRIVGACKVVTNERTYPYLVEIPVAAAGLDIALNRQIVEFHKSRRIQLRHGRTILKDGETYYRWCFPDSTTARAFVEQFGGTFNKLAHAR